MSNSTHYCPNTTEKKWQDYWKTNDTFHQKLDDKKKKYYVLSMFPYPSGNLHVGHVRNYSLGDSVARFRSMNGYNVLHPMGWDSFGLPAENAAINNKVSPKTWTHSNIKNMKKQMQELGIFYDWSREVVTCDPKYYQYEQKFFLELLKKGVAYKKTSAVYWDPVEQTVLANEQVINGRGWRSNAVVEKKELNQWFFKITQYQQELLKDINTLTHWPESVKSAQRNWIGKSNGWVINFDLISKNKVVGTIKVFSDTPENILNCTFISVDIANPVVNNYLNKDPEVLKLQNQAKQNDYNTKYGLKTSFIARNTLIPSKDIPIFINNLVFAYQEYAKMGCPIQNPLDQAFAENHQVSANNSNQISSISKVLNIEEKLLESGDTKKIRQTVIDYIENNNIGYTKTVYKIKDWGVSRQRFWGCPIPVIYCKSCGMLPVQEKNLPVTLPENTEAISHGNYLEKHPTWKHVKCYKCNEDAIRETDTFDTFVESSWYFLRFCSRSNTRMIEKKEADYWMPVDHYIGGIEHATAHLLYARFFLKALRDCGYIENLDEPFKKLSTQGMVLHNTFKDEQGNWVYPDNVIQKNEKLIDKTSNLEVFQGKIEKMSKSKKNVIDLNNMINTYGSDAVRLFLLSDSPPESDMEWSQNGINGAKRFLQNLYQLSLFIISNEKQFKNEQSLELNVMLNKTIKDVTLQIDRMHINKAISSLRILYNTIVKIKDQMNCNVITAFKNLIIMLSPFIPHITQEIWSQINKTDEQLLYVSWPKHSHIQEDDKNYYNLIVQVDSKIKSKVTIPNNITQQDKIEKIALLDNKVISALKEKTILKKILIDKKVINFITK